MSNISLKIYFPEKKLHKIVQLPLERKVQDSIQFIQQKYDCDTTDRGLLFNKTWLDPCKKLEEYGLKYGEVLELRKRQRVLKVMLMDKTMKSVMIDESLPIHKIVSAICQKIGLSNSIEYSLVPVVEKSKISQTKNESKWLDPDQTLRQQCIGEVDMVLLKKKFYFSDQQVDKDDPVQLGLLYSQACDMILQGKHPITLDEAIAFAALQLQITFGNHEPDRFKKGFLVLKDFIPTEYMKQKDVEKKIYVEHAKLYSISSISAKFKYVQLSRSLKTYGITFFLVNERTSNKKSIIQYLLGVSKNGILKMDRKSNQVLCEWKLTQIRRWAATENSFTLDLGDFADSYYAFETNQGDEIAQQVSGYINCILKSRKDQANYAQNSSMFDAKKQIAISPTIKKQMGQDLLEENFDDATRQTKAARESFSIKGLCDDGTIAEKQRKTLEALRNGFVIAETIKADLFVVMNSSDLHEDPSLEAWKNDLLNINIETIASLSASKLSALSNIIMHATGNIYYMEYAIIGSNLNAMIENLRQMAQNIKVLATLFILQESGLVIQLGKSLLDSFISVLAALKNIILGETFMEKFYESTSQLADRISELLFFINKLGIDEAEQKKIIISAGEVAQSVELIQEKAVWLHSSILDEDLLQNIQQYTYNLMETSSMLVAITEVLSPVLDLPRSRETFFLGIILMEESLKPPTIKKDFVSDPQIISDFVDSVEKTEIKLAALIDRLKNEEAEYLDEIEVLFEYIHIATIELLENMGVNSLLQHSKDLINLMENLCTILKGKSEQFRSESERILAINDSNIISKLNELLTENAKVAAKKWDDFETKNTFSGFINDTQAKLEILAAPYIIAASTKKISRAFTNTLSSAHHLISTAKSAGVFNRDQTSQINVTKNIKDMYSIIPGCVQALKFMKDKPKDHVGRSVLIKEASSFTENCEKLMISCKNIMSTVSDQSVKENLSSAINQISNDMEELKKGCSCANHLKGKDEINHAIASLKATQNELENALNSSTKIINLDSKEFYTKDELQSSINLRIKNINIQLNSLKQKDIEYDKSSAGDLAISLVSDYQNLAYSSTQLSDYDGSNDEAKNILRVLNSVGSSLDFMLQTIQKNIREGLPIVADLESLINESIITVEGLNDFLPGAQELIKLEENIIAASENSMAFWSLEASPELISDEDIIYDLENNLRQAALAVAVASSALAKSDLSDNNQLQQDILNFEESYQKFTNESINLSKASYDTSLRDDLEGKIYRMRQLVIELVGAIRGSLVFSPVNAAESVSRKLRETIDTIHLLMDSLILASNSKNPFVTSIKQLDEAFFFLEKAVENVVKDFTLEELIENTNLEGVMVAKKFSSINELSTSKEIAETVASSIKRITLANCDIISFIAYSDSSTQLPSPSLIDQEYFKQKNSKLRNTIERLYHPDVSRDLVLNVAQDIAKLTGKILIQTKHISKNECLNPEDRLYFSNQAQEIGMNISLLIDGLKALATSQTDESRGNYRRSAEYLLKSIDSLAIACEMPKFGKKECIVSSKVALKQRRLFDKNITLIESARDVLSRLKKNPSEGSYSVSCLREAVSELIFAISKERPLFTECEAGKLSIGKSIDILKRAPCEPSGFNSGSKDPHNRRILVDSLSCISSLLEIVLAPEETSTNFDRTEDALLDMVKQFTNNVLITIDIGSALHVTYRTSLFDMYSKLGINMIQFLEKIEVAVLKSNDEMISYIIPHKVELRNHLSGLTAFLIGITGDSLDEYNKVIQQVEKTIVYFNDLERNYVSGDKTLMDYIAQIVESELIFQEFVDELTDHISDSKIPEILELAEQLPSWYINLANEIIGASLIIRDSILHSYLKEAQKDLGGLLIHFIEGMRNEDIMSVNQLSAFLKRKLSEIKESIDNGSHQFLECEKSLRSVNQIIKDFDSAIVLSTSGQLNPISFDKNFTDQKQTLLKEINHLLNSFGCISKASKMSKREVQKAVTQSLQHLILTGKFALEGAAMISSIGDQGKQVSFLSEFRLTILSVFNSINELLALKDTGMNIDQNHCDRLFKGCQNTLKQAISDINSIIATDEIFIDSIDSTQLSLKRSLERFLSEDILYGLENPAEVLITIHSFEDAVHLIIGDSASDHNLLCRNLNILKLKSLALLEGVQACIENAPSSINENCKKSIKTLFESLQTVLKNFKYQKLYCNDQTLDNLIKSKDIFETYLAEFRVFVTKLEPEGFWDKTDPNLINARDLATLANSLEQVSWQMKNQSAQSHSSPDDGGNLEDCFQEFIIKALKEITYAATALIKASIVTQREIVKKGKTLPIAEAMYFSDGTWSDGIVSAAKDVGISTKELGDLVKKVNDDNNQILIIIATARQINASTVQILTASSVHTTATSKSQLVLNSTGKQLMSANEKLVNICESHISQEKIENFSSSITQTSMKAEEIDAKLNILKLEKQLDKARIKLGSMRKFKYSKPGIPFKIKTSLDLNYSDRLNSIDSETMDQVLQRASVLELVNNFDKSVFNAGSRKNSDMDQSPTISSIQRRLFSSTSTNRSNSISSSTSSYPLANITAKLEALEEN